MSEINLKEFNVQGFEPSCTILILGPPGSGKSTLIENILYYNQHKYPTCKIICGIETNYKRYCEVVPPLFVHLNFDEGAESEFIKKRQRNAHRDDTIQEGSRLMIYALDDIGLSRQHFEKGFFSDLFKIGSRHYQQMTIIGSQYPIDFPPRMRSTGSYVIIFNFSDDKTRRKLFENFGGTSLFGSFQTFNTIMNFCTGDYGYLVISFREQTNDIDRRIFYGRTEVINHPWTFGCKEFIKWNEERCGAKYEWSSGEQPPSKTVFQEEIKHPIEEKQIQLDPDPLGVSQNS